jgi:hypothetical protein
MYLIIYLPIHLILYKGELLPLKIKILNFFSSLLVIWIGIQVTQEWTE